MGNSHTHTSRANARGRKRLGRQRRLSEPEADFDTNQLRPNQVESSMSNSSTPPRIQINGMESTEELEEVDQTQMKKSCSMELPSTTKNNHSASLRRMQFLSSSTTTVIAARSFDDARSIADLQLKPLSRAKSHSPLKQMRTYSYRSLSSEENALDKTACELIKNSWHEATKNASTTGRHFGYFVFQRIFQKDPTLKVVFGLKIDDDIAEIPDDHECIRHSKIFTNIIHLAAKNVDELEPQVAPAIFKYGERHYNTKASDRMTEENVRMVCAQVVCTVCDLLGDDAHPKIVEAWIEMMRYLGRKLLDGHEYAKLTAKHRISINRNDHHLFLML
ncbi:hypothetical protein V3C99_009622 [Haemonchus contortus]